MNFRWGEQLQSEDRLEICVGVRRQISEDLPMRGLSFVVTTSKGEMTIDPSGNVDGNPELVEQAAIRLGADGDFCALAALGLARLAIKARRRGV